jgi:hypothetical protein
LKRDFDQAENWPAFVELFRNGSDGRAPGCELRARDSVPCTLVPWRRRDGDPDFFFLPEVIDRSVAKRIPKLLRRESRTRNQRPQAQ